MYQRFTRPLLRKHGARLIKKLHFSSALFAVPLPPRSAFDEITEKGYTVASLGASASIRHMEAVALQLMDVNPSSMGSYNGRGGVVRSSIDGTGFVDSAAGAPKELTIQFHNEMAYALEFPKYVTFAMVKQANVDGTTTLADNVLVQQKLSASLLKKFRELGVQYIRFLHDEAERNAPDFYNSWQGAFQTNSMEDAFEKGNNKTNFSILRKHDARRLRHVLWCPVFHKHPTFGELFFNSVLNRHGSWLDGHSVFGKMPNSERPYHCTWGDGTDLNTEELAEIRKAYAESTEYIRLNPGDVLVLDNLRVVHGRTPYSGSRLLGLLLSDMVPRQPCEPPLAFSKLLQL